MEKKVAFSPEDERNLNPQLLPPLVRSSVSSPGRQLASSLAGAALTGVSAVLLSSVGVGSSVSDVRTGALGLLFGVAASAASHGVSASHSQAQISQSKVLHDVNYSQAKDMQHVNYSQAKVMHLANFRQAQDLHEEELLREAEQHVQDITAQLRESQKEADRDLWEQLNLQKESMMTIAALCLAATFDMAVQGKVPADAPSTLWLTDRLNLLDAYYFCLAMSIAMHFSSILAGLESVNRMSSFMVFRIASQQKTLRKLRGTMMNQLKQLENEHAIKLQLKQLEDEHELRPQPAPEEKEEELTRKREQTFGVKKKLKDMREQFSNLLYQQPMLIFNRRAIGRGKHVSDFGDWFYFDGSSSLSQLNVLLFKAGIVFLVAAIGIYVEAHLRADGATTDEATSDEACMIFWIVTPVCVVVGFFIEVYHVVFPPAPSLRSLIDGDDNEDIKTMSYEYGGGAMTSCAKTSCCRKAFDPITATSVNVMESINAGEKLFDALDQNKDLKLSFYEIVEVFHGTDADLGEAKKIKLATTKELLEKHPMIEAVIPRVLKILAGRSLKDKSDAKEKKLYSDVVSEVKKGMKMLVQLEGWSGTKGGVIDEFVKNRESNRAERERKGVVEFGVEKEEFKNIFQEAVLHLAY